MKFGVCCSEDRFGIVAEMGYDYVETVFSKFTTMTEAEYKQFNSKLKEYNLKSEACNCFFPSDIKLVGDSVNLSQIASYVEKGMERAADAGCKTAVHPLIPNSATVCATDLSVSCANFTAAILNCLSYTARFIN